MSSANSVIRRYSSMVDTSGRYPAPEITAVPFGVMGARSSVAGVYAEAQDVGSILQGRISLGILGAFILGAAGFYYYTRSIQGGG
jgi:hypothetical protein